MKHVLIIWSLIILQCIKNVYLESSIICGKPKPRKVELIVNGYDTIAGAWPWHVALFQKDGKTGKYICGGTLISQIFVLTAAHCVRDKNEQQPAKERTFVRLGVHNRDELNSETIQQHSIHKVHQPSNNASRKLKNDIALLELATDAEFTDYVQPACISAISNLTGQFGTVIGWGVTENDEYSSVLKSSQLPVIDYMTCLESDRTLFGATLDGGIFCAGYTNGTSVCNGDSGSGLFFNKDNVWYLGGIVSFALFRNDGSRLCNPKGYAGFTNVNTYLSWISRVTKLQFLIEQIVTTKVQPEEVQHPNNYLLPKQCGLVSSGIFSGAHVTMVLDYPWMAVLQYENNGTIVDGCGGTLINKRYILTAARCIKTRNSLQLVNIRLGEHTKNQKQDCNIYLDDNGIEDDRECAGPPEDHKIESFVVHANHNEWADIGLIRLKRDVVMKDHIMPICLPVTPELRSLLLSSFIVTGWGVTEHSTGSDVLLEALLPRVNNTDCQQRLAQNWLNIQLTDKQMCAGGQDKLDTCRGDSGGPLGFPAVYYVVPRFVQFGVVSAAVDSCGFNGVPGICTRVGSYMDWILDNLEP